MNPKSITFLSINLIGLLIGQFIPFAQLFGVGPFILFTAIFLEYFGAFHYLFFIGIDFLLMIPEVPLLRFQVVDPMMQFASAKGVVLTMPNDMIAVLSIGYLLCLHVILLYSTHRIFHKVKLFERIALLHSGV